MANEALVPFVRTQADLDRRAEKMSEFQRRLESLADSMPSHESAATVIFNRGMSIPELHRLTKSEGLQVMSLHLKVPYDERGTIQSIDIPSAELTKYRGDFAERATNAIGAIRYKFLEWSEGLPTDDAESHRAIATSPMHVFRCEVFGAASSLRKLSRDSAIAAVVLESEDRAQAKIRQYRTLKARAEEAWANYEAMQSQPNATSQQ
ncbi:hypothetical protein [Lentisalinibacter salinarum]|uniref:hypothetical protein n=1 Tax=Lentisalinibacter salinarum TaxID=2992239 RepID=UPI00386B3B27